MKKTLIKYYFNPDRPPGKDIRNIADGPMCDIADDLLQLICSCTEEEFNRFFINRGRVKLNTAYKTLEDYGLIMKVPSSKEENNYVSKVMCHKNLVSADGKDWFIFTDWPDIAPEDPFYTEDNDIQFNVGRNMVFPIHYEAVYLCNILKGSLSPNSKNILDIFCGSGIFGVYALLNKARSVRFIDNNVRALAFTLLNLAINRNNFRRNYFVSVLYSDIFASLNSNDPNNKFDLILANPPFEPVPEGMKFYFSHSYGGEDGQFFLKLFLQNCLTYLKENGFVIGVDFSPGRGREEDYTLKEIMISFKEVFPEWDTKTKVIDTCNLYEFASRYLALGIDIEDYQNWLYNLSKHKYTMLYFCWFIIGKNLSGTQIPENKSKSNWANPLNWNYPCGITDKNKLPWVYLEDSFFIRENIYSQQLKNECMLSNQGKPEYFGIMKMIKDGNFNKILASFTKSLQEFQYGTLGKPKSVTWMSFPEYNSLDNESGGIIFQSNGQNNIRHERRSRDEMRQFIISKLQNTYPKIIIFYDIYNRNPEECNAYFGEFASCTMSIFISEGNNIVHEIILGKIYNEDLVLFVQEKLSKVSFSVYKQKGDLTSLQTYCFILDWDDDAAILFFNLIRLNDKVIFDGLNKRLLFIISHGLNALATVGLIREASIIEVQRLESERELERSKREESRIKIVLDRVYKLTDDIKHTEIIYKSGNILLEAEDKLAKLSFIDKLWDVGLEKLSDINTKFQQASLVPIKIDPVDDIDIRVDAGAEMSIKHFIELYPNRKNNFDTFVNKLNDIIINIIAKDMPTIFENHINEFNNFLNYNNDKWWPIFGYSVRTNFWQEYLKAKIPSVNFQIGHIQGKPLLLPYFAYVFGAIFQIANNINCNLSLFTSNDGKIVTANAFWPTTEIRNDVNIENLLFMDDVQVHHVRGRLQFLTRIFPRVEGEGFKTTGDITSFNIILRGLL